MIGGQDVIIERPVDDRGKRHILEVLREIWSDAVVEDACADTDPLAIGELVEAKLPDEFFVYRDEASRQSWEDQGATPENADQMIHLLLGPTTVTCVIDGCETAGIAEQIRTALRDISTPMIGDTFFEGLEDPKDWIEADREVA